jgi:hypothetical protein
MDFRDEIARARFLINDTFRNVVFKEDTHQYFIPQPDGSQLEIGCVSNFAKQFESTDFNKIAENYAKNHGETAEYWKSKWAEKGRDACIMGTQVHEYAESEGWLRNGEAEKICQSAKSQYNPLTNKLEPLAGFDKLSLKEQAVKKFWDNIHPNLHFVMAETRVATGIGPYAETGYNQNYAGTFDLLLYYNDPVNQANSGFCIFDWKGLPLDTPIPTIEGYINMGDLKEGMTVFDKDGNPCKILHCSVVHYNPCCKIIFDNGEEIISDIDHRWLVLVGNEEKVMTTKEIRDYSGKETLVIPKAKALNLGDRELPEDPKIFGEKLGKGEYSYIPYDYILSSPEQKLELLSSYFNITKEYNSGVGELLNSSGGFDRIIKSVEDCEMVPTRCIEVDSPSHTYLCTKKFIVTHNTNSSLVNGFARKNKNMMLSPFEDLVDESQGHYTIQLSCYQIPLEAIGLKIIARRLIHLDDKGNFTLVPLPDVTDKIRSVLKKPL